LHIENINTNEIGSEIKLPTAGIHFMSLVHPFIFTELGVKRPLLRKLRKLRKLKNSFFMNY